MKQPLAPKPLHELFAENSEKVPTMLDLRLGPTVGGRYEHWDKLRRREPPEGLTHEQWWLGIKFSRNSQYRQLPFRDTRGRPFVYMLPDQVQQALYRIDSQARGWVGISDHVTNPETRDRFIVSSLIEEAITSSQLEGASTPRVVATNMIRAGRRPRDRSERMILNNYRVMEDIRRLRENPLTIDTLLQLHATLTADTLGDSESEGRIQRPG